MTPNEYQKLAIKGLNQLRGDDLERVKGYFRGYSAAQMQEQHGYSGVTRAAVLQGYKDQEQPITDAINWVLKASVSEPESEAQLPIAFMSEYLPDAGDSLIFGCRFSDLNHDELMAVASYALQYADRRTADADRHRDFMRELEELRGKS